MQLLSWFFLGSLLIGQLGGIPVATGAVIYIHDILLTLLLAEGFVQFALRGRLVRPKLFVPIVLFAVAALLSLLTNSGEFGLTKLGLSSLYLVRWLFYAGIYVVIVQEFVSVSTWLWGLFGVGIGFAILGFLQFFLYPDLRNLMYLGWDPHFYRLFSTLLDPNFVGILLVFTVVLGIALWSLKKMRVLVVLGEIISFIALLLTYSRSSFLALASVIVMFGILKKNIKVLVAVGLFVLLVIFLPRIPGSTLSLFRVDSSEARIGNWQQSVSLFLSAPLFGHGFDTLRYLAPTGWKFISKSASGVDSSILFMGVTSGIVGLAAYGYLVYRMLAIGIILTKKKKTASFGIPYILFFVALGVHSLFANSAFYPWVLLWMWILTGVAELVSGGTSLS